MRTKYGKMFPYLAGATGTSKILSLWLRMMRDEAGVDFTNLENVPLPVDIHTARATITSGCLVGKFVGSFNDLVIQTQEAWKEACKKTRFYPLQVDEPLWNLSRHGCRNRSNGAPCPKRNECRLASFCTANLPESVISLSQDGITYVDTQYPLQMKT